MSLELDERQRGMLREMGIELFWPEIAPAAGRNNLSKALTSLRHQLEPPGVPTGAVLVTDNASVRLNHGDTLEIVTFVGGG